MHVVFIAARYTYSGIDRRKSLERGNAHETAVELVAIGAYSPVQTVAKVKS